MNPMYALSLVLGNHDSIAKLLVALGDGGPGRHFLWAANDRFKEQPHRYTSELADRDKGTGRMSRDLGTTSQSG